MSDQLTTEQITEFKEIFDMYAVNGTITRREFMTVRRTLECQPAESYISDFEEDEQIDFNEFLGYFALKMRDTDTYDDLLECFRKFDIEGTGMIEARDLRDILLSAGETLTEEEIEEIKHIMIKDGCIKYEEALKNLLN